jgi:hypothetical protein
MVMQRTALGSRLWLHHDRQKADEVVISAHGGYYKGTLAFDLKEVARVNPTRVFFWTRHGYKSGQKLRESLTASALAFSERSGINRKEIEYANVGKAASSVVLNYELFPFGHDDNEGVVSAMQKAREAGDQAVRDVITIRGNGLFRRTHIYLKDVIKIAQDIHPYKTFYCTFCRVLMGEGVKFQNYWTEDDGTEEGIPRVDQAMSGGWQKAATLAEHGWVEDIE